MLVFMCVYGATQISQQHIPDPDSLERDMQVCISCYQNTQWALELFHQQASSCKIQWPDIQWSEMNS